MYASNADYVQLNTQISIKKTGKEVFFKYTDLNRYTYFLNCYHHESCIVDNTRVKYPKNSFFYTLLFNLTNGHASFNSYISIARFCVTISGIFTSVCLLLGIYYIFFYALGLVYTKNEDIQIFLRRYGTFFVLAPFTLMYIIGFIYRIMGVITYNNNNKIISYYKMYTRMIYDEIVIKAFATTCNEFFEMDKTDFLNQLSIKGIGVNNVSMQSAVFQQLEFNRKVKFMVYNSEWRYKNDRFKEDLESYLCTILMALFIGFHLFLIYQCYIWFILGNGIPGFIIVDFRKK